MKPDPIENMYPTDDCMMENFSETHLCQLIRDESFGWPLQDPDLDADPFNSPSHQALDFDISAFDSTDREGNMCQPWSCERESNPIPESAWQQLAINLNSPTSKQPSCSSPSLVDSTLLTPCLAALDFSHSPSLPDELEFTASGGLPSSKYLQKRDFFQDHQTLDECQQYPKWEYQQGGDLGRGMYVVQQPSGPGDVITIGIYTRAERAAKIYRFRQKRERRNFSKRVLYGSRKRFADSRPRVGGRFVVNENRVIKPKTFLKRGRPRKAPLLPMINCLAASLLLN